MSFRPCLKRAQSGPAIEPPRELGDGCQAEVGDPNTIVRGSQLPNRSSLTARAIKELKLVPELAARFGEGKCLRHTGAAFCSQDFS
jgi:hypothetical protein